MHLFRTLAITTATAYAFSSSDISEYGNSALAAAKRSISTLKNRGDISLVPKICPAVWFVVAVELTTKFVENGQCNDLARAAMRQAFHDCGAWNTAQGQKGGCDGSLILTSIPTPQAGDNAELNRNENLGLAAVGQFTYDLVQKYKKVDPTVTVADFIQFAASVAIVACPGGPQIKTYVGRKDSTTPAPKGLLPSVVGSALSLFKLFLGKGFTDEELAALLGAHSTSRAFYQTAHNIPSGASQDSTPGIWDVKYYSETLQIPVNTDPDAPNTIVAVFPSDKNLATDSSTPVKDRFAGFVNNPGKWRAKFADAMTHLSLLGTAGASSLIDCTTAVPLGTVGKRDMRAAPIMDRVR